MDVDSHLIKALHINQSWVQSVQSDDFIQHCISSRNFIVKTADFLDDLACKGFFGCIGSAIL